MDLEKILNQLIDCLDNSGDAINDNKKIAYSEGYLDCLANMGLISHLEEIRLLKMVK